MIGKIVVFLAICMFIVSCSNGGNVKMELKSHAFKNGGKIPSKFTCEGEDINPQLSWSDVPEGTKSFALIVDDPDAPSDTWVHWLVKNIPHTVKEIKEDSVVGKEVPNSWDRKEWGGPCPPKGNYRYMFKLYALNVSKIDAETRGQFYEQVDEHKIEEAVLMGTYEQS